MNKGLDTGFNSNTRKTGKSIQNSGLQNVLDQELVICEQSNESGSAREFSHRSFFSDKEVSQPSSRETEDIEHQNLIQARKMLIDRPELR